MNQALKAVAQQGNAARAQRTIFNYLDDAKVRAGLAAVAGKVMQPDRLMRLLVNCVKKTPKLLECDPVSVLGAMMTTAALGLEPNTVQQQSFLIPYRKSVKVGKEWVQVYDCQFQIGARGFVTLAYRSPHIKSIFAEAVHTGDHFKHRLGSQTFLEYEKTLDERGPLKGAFSYVRLTDGGESAFVLPLEEIYKIRSKSETFRSLGAKVDAAENDNARARAIEKFEDQPWVMWEDDMAAKSAIKKHAKQLPINAGDAMAAAAEIDDKSEGTIDMRVMADPDVARSVVAGEEGAPLAIENDESETLQFDTSKEAFATRERAQAAQQNSEGPKTAQQQDTPAAKVLAQRDQDAARNQQAEALAQQRSKQQPAQQQSTEEWEPTEEEMAEIAAREREDAAAEAKLTDAQVYGHRETKPAPEPQRRTRAAGPKPSME